MESSRKIAGKSGTIGAFFIDGKSIKRLGTAINGRTVPLLASLLASLIYS